LCSQLTNVQNLHRHMETKGEDGNHSAPWSPCSGYVFRGELCQAMWQDGALTLTCCLSPQSIFGLCSRQNKMEPSFLLNTSAYHPSCAKPSDLWVLVQSHSRHTSQLWDQHGWGHVQCQAQKGKKSFFPVERGETQQRDYEGVSHHVPSTWLQGQGGLLFQGWGKVTASPVIIVSHNPSYTKSSRNHTCKCLNLKCKINTGKRAATYFIWIYPEARSASTEVKSSFAISGRGSEIQPFIWEDINNQIAVLICHRDRGVIRHFGCCYK